MSRPDANLLPIEECFKIVQRLKQVGLTEEERDDFVAKALIRQADSNRAAKAKLEDSAKIAKEVDDVFYQEAALLLALAFVFIPILLLYGNWITLFKEWRDCLRFSMTLASDLAEILRRFDQIYLEQVENITTDSERLRAMAALTSFITELEKNDKSAELSRRLLDLKRDVAAFGEIFLGIAKTSAVIPLTKEIETLDELIKDTQNVVRGIFEGTRLITAVGAETAISKVFSSLQFYREEKVETLRKVNQAQAGIDSLVAERSEIKLNAEFKAPDIALLLENLVGFAEIWASVRSECVQINSMLAGGMEAVSTPTFKKGVKLAREESRPLREGLLVYNRELQVWIDAKIGE